MDSVPFAINGPGAFYLLADFENFAPFLMPNLLREITGSSFDLSEVGDGPGRGGPWPMGRR